MTITKEERKDHDPLSLPPATKKMRVFSTFIFFVLGFALATFIFWNPFEISFLPTGPAERVQEEEALAADNTEETQLWTCPMHPHVLEKEPGNCPICSMKLVSVAAKEGHDPMAAAKTKGKKERQVKYWQAPMDPT